MRKFMKIIFISADKEALKFQKKEVDDMKFKLFSVPTLKRYQ